MKASVPLRRVTSMTYGGALAAEARREGSIPVMSSGGVTGWHDTANTTGPCIVVGRKGSHGSVWWSESPTFVIDTAYSIDRTNARCDLRWLYYVLLSARLSDLSADVGVPGLSREFAYETLIPKPPAIDEQRRIADFLDDQVARIDNIVAARGAQVRLINEEADANWAREAAGFTELVPLRRFLESITDGPFGSALTSAHYSESGVRVIRLGNLGIAEFRDADKAYVSEEYGAELVQHAVRPGDLLMAGLGDERWPLGRSVEAPSGLGPAIVKADCYRIRLRSELEVSFAAWFLSAPQSRWRFLELARGSTRARLNTQLAREALVPIARREEQQSIVAAFVRDRAVTKAKLGGLLSSVSLVEELKRSLITAAVTGEFDVSSADGSRVPA